VIVDSKETNYHLYSIYRENIPWSKRKKKEWGLIGRFCIICKRELGIYERGIKYCNKHKPSTNKYKPKNATFASLKSSG